MTPSPLAKSVAKHPLSERVKRLSETLNRLGSPLPKTARRALEQALRETNEAQREKAIQATLDPFCLLEIEINPESRVRVVPGAARPRLVQRRWRAFLLKVQNEAGVTAKLRVSSPNALPVLPPQRPERHRWLALSLVQGSPPMPHLTGRKLEYRILRLYSRDAGKREAKIAFDVGQGTQDIGFRNEVNLLFNCAPAQDQTKHSRRASRPLEVHRAKRKL